MSHSSKSVPHGGDLAAATARFGAPAEGWLDLSTGINPCPYPLPAIPESAWTRLPQHDREAALLDVARSTYGVAPAAAIVAGPGTQAIIQWLPRLLPPGRVRVHGPTYGEHAAAWVETGHALVAADDAPSAVEVFVNPNNPDGRLYPHDELLQSAGRCAAAGGFAVVDEAFADVAPEAALDASANTPGLVILRSVGKFFGLPGLRIGFALGDPATIERLRRAMGPWAVSGPALELAAAALADAAWIDETRTRLRALRRRLDEVLSGAGLELLGGTDLFRLVRHEEAGAVCGHLGGKGILVRTFDYAPEWLRFGLPGDDIGFERLSKALASCGR